MMGRQPGGQKQLFYSFNLDDHVPPDHLLRGIDQFLDLGDLHPHLAPFYSHTGRPSIDPQLLIRMLIVGYCFGIRSERRLCEEVHLNLAYRWFCRLGLEDQVPDHSTFSKNRHGRFRDSDTLRFVFEQVLERCVREGLVGGEGFAIDASLVKADANRQRGVPGTEADWSDRRSISRPVREYLAALDQAEVEKNTPKNISLTDPAAQWSAAGGPAFYAYSANYLVDTAAGIVVDVEATPAHKIDEINATKTMIERVETRFDLKPQRLIGDTNYGTAEILGWMVNEKAIEPHVPVWDKTQRNVPSPVTKADGQRTMLFRGQAMGVRHTTLAVFETWRTITQSARSSNDCGMVMPSAFAVLRVDTQLELRDEGGDVMKNSRDYSSRYFVCPNALGAATRSNSNIVI
jgi:transposase